MIMALEWRVEALKNIVFKHHHQQECFNAASSSSPRVCAPTLPPKPTQWAKSQHSTNYGQTNTQRETTTTCTHNMFNIVFKSRYHPPFSHLLDRLSTATLSGWLNTLLHFCVEWQKLNSVACGTQCMLVLWIYVFTLDAWLLLCWQQFCLILHAQLSLELCGIKVVKKSLFRYVWQHKIHISLHKATEEKGFQAI